MRLLTILAVIVLVVQASGGAAKAQLPSGVLYFLNSPESVKRAGVLGRWRSPIGEVVRGFYHFQNRTGHTQRFVFSASADMGGIRRGHCVFSGPAQAGIQAAAAFMSAAPSTSPGPLLVDALVPPNYTVSGIFEGEALADTRFVCSLGAASDSLKWSVVRVPYTQVVSKVDLKVGKVVTRLAGDSGGPSRVAGNYGMDMKAQFVNNTKRSLSVTLRVRAAAGRLILAYTVDGAVKITPMYSAYSVHTLGTWTVHSGKSLTLNMIPAGGFCYPCDIWAESDTIGDAMGPLE